MRRCPSGVQLMYSVGERYRAEMNFVHHSSNAPTPFGQWAQALIFCAAKNFRSRRRDYQRWLSVYGVALTVANVCKAVVNGIERRLILFTAPATLQHRSTGLLALSIGWLIIRGQCVRLSCGVWPSQIILKTIIKMVQTAALLCTHCVRVGVCQCSPTV